jgi:HD-like signal output (HDOD) protein
MNPKPARGSAAIPARDVHEVMRTALREGGVELLPMPQVAWRIVSLAFDPSSDATDLATLIERDPTLAGHVMRVANSSMYRPRSPISSLQQAITWLGNSEVQNLAVALAVRGQVFTAPGHEREVDALWHESVAAAFWGREIATLVRDDADIAYLCGLLHCIGRAAVVRMLVRVESSHASVLEERTFAALLDEFEDDFAHRICADWRLPARVAAGVTGWRNFVAAREFREQAALTQASVQLATASLHPDLLTPEYFVTHPVFVRLRLGEAEVGQLLGRSETVRNFVATL